jgi:ATP-dependent protease ClpP protease subunit
MPPSTTCYNRKEVVAQDEKSHTTNAGPGQSAFDISRNKNCIYFSGDLYDTSCEALSSALRDAFAFCNASTDKGEKHVNLRLQSHGGSLLSTFAVIDTITQQPVPVHCQVAGYAFSAGAVLTIACTKRFMTQNCVMMLHESSTGLNGGQSYEDIARHLHDVGLIEKIKNNMIKKRSKLTLNKIKAIEKKGHWLTAEQCLKFGLVDKIH